MNRPVLVHSGELLVGVDKSISINPWQLYFDNPRVSEKLKYFRNLRCDLKIKLVVNGNPFYYGSYIMYYQPLHQVDSRTSDGSTLAEMIQVSQLPHIYIDPCSGTGGELSIPYFYNKDAVNIVEREYSALGQLHIRTIVPLQHANDSTSPVDVSVFVMAENVSLSTPTSRPPMENQADEYGKPSMVAHSVAKAAGWFGAVPVIGKYARATQMIMSSMGDVASMFGYSRPREIVEAKSYRHRPAGNLSVVNIPDNIASMALDAKKEVTIDPRVVGLKSSDEMALTPIAMRESFLTNFPWRESDSADRHLFSVRVNPIQGVSVGDFNYITPAAFTSLPFRYWRGTMQFRFNVIASMYHRGRLKFVWDPEYNAEDSARNYNSNYVTIVDINQQKDITLDIGWGSNFSYLETGGLLMDKWSTSPFTESSRWSNGTLSVFVVNSLTSPSPTTNDVSISVFANMCEDYEVACPDSLFMEGDLGLRSVDIPPPVDLPPIDGDDGTGPQPPVPPIDPTPPEPEPEPEPEPGDPVEITIPDGIGFGTRRLWPNPADGQGTAVDRVTDEARILGGGVTTIVVPPFQNGATLSLFSSANRSVTIEHLNQARSTLTTTAINLIANSTTPVQIPSTAGNNMSDDRHFIRITDGGTNVTIFRLVSLDINGVVSRKLTAEEANAVATGVAPVYDDGALEFLLGPNQKMEFDVLPGLTSANKPIIHYMAEGTSGAVHVYNGINRAPGADSASKFAVGEVLTYESPGKVALKPFNNALMASPINFEGYILMYYPSIENQADDDVPTTDYATAPVAESSDVRMAPSLPGMEVNSVYFGEQVTSWRQVLKRYETISLLTSGTPTRRWYDSFTEQGGSVGLNIRRLSMVDYVKSAYVGVRGGMRLKIIPLTPLSTAGSIVISNVSDSSRGDVTFSTSPIYPNFTGSTYDPLFLTGAADAEVPYYSNLRFFNSRLSGREYTGLQGRDPRRGIQRLEAAISFHGADLSSRYALLHSVAEDYSLHFFLSAPVLEVSANNGAGPPINPPFG